MLAPGVDRAVVDGASWSAAPSLIMATRDVAVGAGSLNRSWRSILARLGAQRQAHQQFASPASTACQLKVSGIGAGHDQRPAVVPTAELPE